MVGMRPAISPHKLTTESSRKVAGSDSRKEDTMDPLAQGFSMPVTAPLYGTPPYHFRGARIVLAEWEADTEKVLRHLPDGVVPAHDKVRCIAWVCEYPFSSLGPYLESALLVRVTVDDEPYQFLPFLYVNSDAAQANGREVWGYPKKFADMEFSYGASSAGNRNQFLHTTERPLGRRILSVSMTPEQPAKVEDLDGQPALTLRVIPNAEAGKRPSVCELVATSPVATYHTKADGKPDLWSGTATVTMDSPSESDPLVDFAPVRMLSAYYGVCDMLLPQGKVIKDYLQ